MRPLKAILSSVTRFVRSVRTASFVRHPSSSSACSPTSMSMSAFRSFFP